MTYTVNNTKTAAVSTDVFWLPITECPDGVKVLLLTVHGVAIVSHYAASKNGGFFTHWHPLPKRRPADAQAQ